MELYSHVLKVVVSVEEDLEEDRSEKVTSANVLRSCW